MGSEVISTTEALGVPESQEWTRHSDGALIVYKHNSLAGGAGRTRGQGVGPQQRGGFRVFRVFEGRAAGGHHAQHAHLGARSQIQIP